jgi:preprotein translocase subunit SecA
LFDKLRNLFGRGKGEDKQPPKPPASPSGGGEEGDDGVEKKGFLDGVKKLFDKDAHTVKRLQPTLDRVNEIGKTLVQKTDDELKAMSEELKERFRQRVAEKLSLRGLEWRELDPKWILEDDDYEKTRRAVENEVMDELLPDAFALCREVAWRTIQLRPYDVQVIGGIVLHQGKIAEMKTGEGKTLAATMPVYLNALTGRGVHVITVNDYLAERDANWMRPVYEFLGLTVGFVTSEMDYYSHNEQRRAAYRCDVLYGTNSEVGFDYLRDNLATDADRLVQRPLNFAIVDEVDNILIDEARTPLIISAQVELSDRAALKRTLAKVCDTIARKLLPATHEREVERTIDKFNQNRSLDVAGLMDFILQRGCLTTAVGYLADCYLAPESSARMENAARLLNTVDELEDLRLIDAAGAEHLRQMVSQLPSASQAQALVSREVQNLFAPFAAAAETSLRWLSHEGANEDPRAKGQALTQIVRAHLYLNESTSLQLEEAFQKGNNDRERERLIAETIAEEIARRSLIDDKSVPELINVLMTVDVNADVLPVLLESVSRLPGPLATAAQLFADCSQWEQQNPDASPSEQARQLIATIEQISAERLLPHELTERLWEQARLKQPREQLRKEIAATLKAHPGAGTTEIMAAVNEFQRERQAWLKQNADKLQTQLSQAKGLPKPSLDLLAQRARQGASAEEIRRTLRTELSKVGANAEALKAVKKFSNAQTRACEDIGNNLLKEMEQWVDVSRDARKNVIATLVAGGSATELREVLNEQVSDLPGEQTEALKLVSECVEQVVRWRMEHGEALMQELTNLAGLSEEASAEIRTAIEDGVSAERLEHVVMDHVLRLPANAAVTNAVETFSADWSEWQEQHSENVVHRLNEVVPVSSDLHAECLDVLRGSSDFSRSHPTHAHVSIVDQLLDTIAGDVTGRHLESLLTEENAVLFVEELKKRIPLAKEVQSKVRAEDFAGRNKEQIVRAVLRLVEQTLAVVPIEEPKGFNMKQAVKSYGWYLEKDEKHRQAALTDMGTLVAERDIGSPSFLDPQNLLETLTENDALRDEEVAEVERALIAEEGRRQVSQVILQVLQLDPTRRKRIRELKFQEINPILDQAIRAHSLFEKNVHYVVDRESGTPEIVIVDEFTGRKMHGRRWSEGLHEAVEAKEGLEVRLESQTVATVTIQNYFKLYYKIAGMTGTAKTEEPEFVKVYGLEVVSIPTNKPVRRTDSPDVVWKTSEQKFRAVTFEILEKHCIGQPVLVGTRSVEVSERLAERMKGHHLQTLALVQLIKNNLWERKDMDNKEKSALLASLNIPLFQLNQSAVRNLARQLGLPGDVFDAKNLEKVSSLLNLQPKHVTRLASALKAGIPHNVLNAKNHRNEARIIAEAARLGAVTIATNMAGRGVDIILGGTLDAEAKLRVITQQIVGQCLTPPTPLLDKEGQGEIARVRSRTQESTDKLFERLKPQRLQDLVWATTVSETLTALRREGKLDDFKEKEMRDALHADLETPDFRNRVRSKARRLAIGQDLPLDDDVFAGNRVAQFASVTGLPSDGLAEFLRNGVFGFSYRRDPRDAMLVRAMAELLRNGANGSMGQWVNGSMSQQNRAASVNERTPAEGEFTPDEILAAMTSLNPQSAIWATPEWLDEKLWSLNILRGPQDVRAESVVATSVAPESGVAVAEQTEEQTLIYKIQASRLLDLLDHELLESVVRLANGRTNVALSAAQLAQQVSAAEKWCVDWLDEAWVAERMEAMGLWEKSTGKGAMPAARHTFIPQVVVETGVAGQSADLVVMGVMRPEDTVTSEYQEVRALGGLHILGTERHESRRIDNQLRGRAGRQGDPGSSRFHVALEDELWQNFGDVTGRFKFLMNQWTEDEAVEHSLLTKAITNAQKKVETNHFEGRKHVLQYDEVMNIQRQVIYRERRRALMGANVRETVVDMAEQAALNLVEEFCPAALRPDEWQLNRLYQGLHRLFGQRHVTEYLTEDELEGASRDAIQDAVRDAIRRAYEDHEREITPEVMAEVGRWVLCDRIDDLWMEHLAAMDYLREGISLRAYGQKDPIVEYKKEAYEMFQGMMASLQAEVATMVMSVVPEEAQRWAHARLRSRLRSMQLHWSDGGNGSAATSTPERSEPKVGRNDPCPCGSGKKYKNCCMRKEQQSA